jgi:hypothetical protein
MKKENTWFSSFYCSVFQFLNRKSMFAVLHLDINYLMSGLCHFTGHSDCKKSRSAKAKDGIINFILRNYLLGQYQPWSNLLSDF